MLGLGWQRPGRPRHHRRRRRAPCPPPSPTDSRCESAIGRRRRGARVAASGPRLGRRHSHAAGRRGGRSRPRSVRAARRAISARRSRTRSRRPTAIGDDVRDAVILEVSDEALHGFQYPERLIEPALGGPDTTERAFVNFRFRLLRLGADEDCNTILGKLRTIRRPRAGSASLAPVVAIGGDCPVVGGGGYTGFEHNLYRIEIATTRRHRRASSGASGTAGSSDAGASTPRRRHHRRRPHRDHQRRPHVVLPRGAAVRCADGTGAWAVVYGTAATLNTDHDLELPSAEVWHDAVDHRLRVLSAVERHRHLSSRMRPTRSSCATASAWCSTRPRPETTGPERASALSPEATRDRESAAAGWQPGST